jgi:hypothetical protein
LCQIVVDTPPTLPFRCFAGFTDTFTDHIIVSWNAAFLIEDSGWHTNLK